MEGGQSSGKGEWRRSSGKGEPEKLSGKAVLAGRAPRISVLLPCRDAADTLPEAIASLEEQTFEDFEVLTVDDGSTDRTMAHLDRWALHDARVQVLRTGRRGLVAALAAALDGARGELDRKSVV